MINVFVDMDGVIADFMKDADKYGMHPEKFKMQPGAFLNLEWMPTAQHGLTQLLAYHNEFNVWIATKPPAKNPYACAEKILWVRHNVPVLERKVILTQDKSLLGGPKDILIDDRPYKANAIGFKGTVMHYGGDACKDWTHVLRALREKYIEED
jgi:5'(3')-deoxyribonucleotidase